MTKIRNLRCTAFGKENETFDELDGLTWRWGAGQGVEQGELGKGGWIFFTQESEVTSYSILCGFLKSIWQNPTYFIITLFSRKVIK